MFLTVTPNAVLDKIIFIDEFTPGIPMHARRVAWSAGGKGLDASVALHHLGQDSTGVCCLAGKTGDELLAVIARYPHITPAVVQVGGETRTAHIIAEDKRRLHTHIFTGGLSLAPEHTRALLERCAALLPGARFALTGGMLPPGAPIDFFHQLAGVAARAGVPLLVDSWREPLLACLPDAPAILKMNRDEFGWTFGLAPASLAELKALAAGVFRQHNLPALVVTCGKDGMLAFTAQGAFHALPPAQPVANAAGAGDVASAALAWRLVEGDTWPDALRWAAAASAASVRTEGTADLDMSLARQILPEVALEAIA